MPDRLRCVGITPEGPPPHERLMPRYSEDWGRTLEAAHDAYMERLQDGVERDLWDHDDGVMDGLDMAGEPYCGCETCERRASWLFLMAWIIDAYEEGVVEVERRTSAPPPLAVVPPPVEAG